LKSVWKLRSTGKAVAMSHRGDNNLRSWVSTRNDSQAKGLHYFFPKEKKRKGKEKQSALAESS
jgi:hypothetical protein